MVITSLGEIDHAGDFQWSRDGSKVALVRDVRSGAISIVNSRGSREERRLVVHPGAQISSLAWSPTGDALLVVARAPHDEFSSLFLVNIGNGVTTRIFQPAYELSNVVWSNDGKLFGVEAVRGGRFEVVVGDVSVEGARRTLTPESHSYRIIDVATNGDSLHVRGGPLTDSPVVSSIGWNGERTLFPGQAVVTGPSPSVVNIPAADGKLIPTLLWRPTTNSGVPDEAVMFIHGGPHLQELPTLDGRIAASLKLNQFVVIPNYRGSSGYGASWERYEDVRQQARDIADVQGYVEHTLQIAPHKISAVASSYGMRPTLYVLRDNPRAFGTVMLTSLVRPTDEVCPIVGFTGTIFGFHGQNDPMQDAQEAKDIFQRCTEKVRNKFWKILPEEGHHFHRTTSLEIVLSALLER
jgi:dipeptidyl aminopeptidase/acylaminoacyl peptidase